MQPFFAFSVSLRIYEEGAEGDILRESYDSDAAWLTQDGAYDPSEREVEVPLKTTASLSGMYVMVSAFIESRVNYFNIWSKKRFFYICNFFWSFIYKKNNKMNFRVTCLD